MLQRFCVIVGPTAGGKSSLAMHIAEAASADHSCRGEIVSADSMQVYRGMDIGTAKPSTADQSRFPHHLIDLREPTDAFSVDEWLRLAEQCINDIRGRGGLPIVVGGTHFYIKALLEGLLKGPEPDPDLRRELSAMDDSLRRQELERVDPAAAQRIHPNDIRRTVRALEVFRQTGTPLSQLQQQWDRGTHRPDALLIGLNWPTELINRRINDRVRDMVRQGLVQEVRSLWESHQLGSQASEALGYKQLIQHFEGRCSEGEAIEQIKVETRRFAKNQRTWLKRLRSTPESVWIDAPISDTSKQLQTIVNTVLR